MNRENKVRFLSAIATGNMEAIAKRVPPTFARKFPDLKALQERIPVIYGPNARMINLKGTFWVLGSLPHPVLFFYRQPDGIVTDFHGITFTAAEHEQICREFDGIAWDEEKTYSDGKTITMTKAAYEPNTDQ